MLKRTLLLMGVLTAIALTSSPPPAQAASELALTSATALSPAPVADHTLFDLTGGALLLGLVGVTEEKPKTKKVKLSQAHIFRGVTYMPGDDVEVPEDFVDPDPDGVVRHASNRVLQSSVPRAPAVASAENPPDTDETVSGYSKEALQDMRKNELAALADRLGIEVKRKGGEEGDPLHEDYVRTLGRKKPVS